MRRSIAAVGLIAISTTNHASEINNARILSVLAGENYGSKVFLEVSPKPNVTCSGVNPTYSYVFDPTTPVGKITLSLVLTAYSAGKDVYLSGTSYCTLYGGVENLHQIVVK